MTDTYWKGYYSYISGVTVNPYPIGSDDWYNWDMGWEDAEIEDER